MKSGVKFSQNANNFLNHTTNHLNHSFMKRFILTALAFILMVPMLSAGNYKSFTVAIYTRAYEVDKMSDPHYLDSTWNIISSFVSIKMTGCSI